MEAAERDLVLQHLDGSRRRLLDTVQGLSPEQLSFKPAADCWSVADCVEHIIVVEHFVLDSIERRLQSPPEPQKHAETVGKDEVIQERVPARNFRVKGPEAVMPTGRWPEFAALLAQFEVARNRTVQFTTGTEADLRNHFFPHPFLGQFDCYQWLLFIGTHCERHVRQMEEVLGASRSGLMASA
jgi:hypothetical protein